MSHSSYLAGASCLAVVVLACGSSLATTATGTDTTKAANAQQKKPACSAAKFREFDFWVGSWEVTDGSTGKRAGRNEITLEQEVCVVVERWHSASGRTGLSMNHYDPVADKWRQHWVGLGLILEAAGGMQAGSMVLEGPLQYLDTGEVTVLRGIWTPLPDGRVRQHFLESKDQGKTWAEWFDGYYTRARSP